MENKDEEYARKEVSAFIGELYTRFGLSEQDVRELLDTVLRLRRRAEFARKLGQGTAISVATFIVISILYGVAWAVNHYVQSLVGG